MSTKLAQITFTNKVAPQSILVQSAGYVRFEDGTLCARYKDLNGNYYFWPDLYTEKYMIAVHGKYELN